MRCLSVMVLMLAAMAARAAGPGTELEQVEKAWAAAVVAGNVSTLQTMLADELIYAHSTGVIETKAQYLDRLRSGVQKYEKVEHESVRAVPHGNAGVTHSLMQMHGMSNGKPFRDHVMMMHVWVKQGGTWKLAAHQTTKLAQ